jgi:hypothetical protein
MQVQSQARSKPVSRAAQIPTIIQRSPLYQRGGFVLIEHLLEPSSLAKLQRESLALSSQAQENALLETDHSTFDLDFGRGGSPARKFLSTQGGTVQDAFYHSSALRDMLESLTQTRIKPTGARGTFSYYARSGDFLALHRDILQCDLTLITCLFDHTRGENNHPSKNGGVLRAYPNHNLEPLSSITAHTEGEDLRLGVGQSLALLGGVVPHEVLPTNPGQIRVVSVLCFEIQI